MKKKLIMLSVFCIFGNEVLGMNADVMRCRRMFYEKVVNNGLSYMGCPICPNNNIQNRIIEKIDGADWKNSPYLSEDVIRDCFPEHGELDVNFEKLKSYAPNIIYNAMLKCLGEENMGGEKTTLGYVNDFIKQSSIADAETGLPTFDLEQCRDTFKFLEEAQVERVFGTFNTIVKMLNYENFCNYSMERIQASVSADKKEVSDLLSNPDISAEEINNKMEGIKKALNIQASTRRLKDENKELYDQLQKKKLENIVLASKIKDYKQFYTYMAYNDE